LLHITGWFTRWDCEAAKKLGALFADICRADLADMVKKLLVPVGNRLTLELLKSQLDPERDLAELEQNPVCRSLVQNMLEGGNTHFTVP
jgi:hypothetical protein